MDDEGKQESKGDHLAGFGISMPVPKSFRALDALLTVPMDYAKERLEAYFDRKRIENLFSHVDAVRLANKNKEIKYTEPSVFQIELIEQWSQKAQRVGDENPQLAAAWRAVLDKLQANDPDAEDILLAISNITSSDIYFFVAKFSKRSMRENKLVWAHLEKLDPGYTVWDEPRLKRLQHVGLIADNQVLANLLRTGIIFIVGVAIAIVFFFNLFPKQTLLSVDFVENMLPHLVNNLRKSVAIVAPLAMYASVFLFGLIAAFEICIRYFYKYSLTESGEKFISSFMKYLSLILENDEPIV